MAIRGARLVGKGRLYHVKLDLRIEPGELRHVRSMLLNVTEVHEVDYCPSPDLPADTFCMLKHRRPGLSISQPFDGEPAVAEEDEEQWEQRVVNEIRHRRRAVARRDFEDLVAAEFPRAKLLDVAPTRVQVAGRFHDAVRLTVMPESWEDPGDLLDQATILARRIRDYFSDKTMAGIRVVAGPPSMILAESPAPDDPLWLHRDLIVNADRVPCDRKVCRRDGVFWPAFTLAELRG
jgi:hypothetical protein